MRKEQVTDPRVTDPLYRKFRAHVLKEGYFEKGEKVVLGLSGGLDSMVLAHLLQRYASQFGIRPVAGHIHFDLRGEEAKRQLKFVKDRCKELGIPLFVKRVPPIKSRENFQQWARKIRYDFFEGLTKKLGAKKIVVAHHQDDQLETVLENFLRGAGFQGLAGMPERRNLKGGPELIRPLLLFSRGELKEFSKRQRICHFEDSSNQSKKYFRNRIRLELLPFLTKFNPAVRKRILELRELSTQWSETWGYFASKVGTPWMVGKNRLRCAPRGILLRLPQGLRFEFLSLAYRNLTGGVDGLKRDHLVKMDRILCSETKEKGSYSLPHSIRFQRSFEEIFLGSPTLGSGTFLRRIA